MTESKLFIPDPTCNCRDFFDRENFSEGLNPLAFKEFNILDHEQRVNLFVNENVNAAASYVRLFEETKNDADWFHVTVNATGFDFFVENMLNDERFKFLPFSCWCDGDYPYVAERCRQHRHMIMVSKPKEHFEKEFFPNMKVMGESIDQLCIILKQIESPLHLIKLISCLGNRECHLKDGTKTVDKHFYIFKSVPLNYMWLACLQVDGGITTLCDRENSVSQIGLVGEGDEYKIKLTDFKGESWLLPLKKGYTPSFLEENADCFMYLMGGDKLYFKYSREKVDDETCGMEVCFYEKK